MQFRLGCWTICSLWSSEIARAKVLETDETSSLLQLRLVGTDDTDCVTGKCHTTTSEPTTTTTTTSEPTTTTTTTSEPTTTTTTTSEPTTTTTTTTTAKCDVCSDFACPDTYHLRENADDLCGADRPTCCLKDGICSGQPVGSPCSLGDIDASLIPNPSFESRVGCPTDVSQLNKANSWHQATEATSDFIVKGGGCSPSGHMSRLVIPPAADGVAMVGTIAMPKHIGYIEYVGACLTSPLQAGTTYTMTMSAAAALMPVQQSVYGGDTNGHTELLCIPQCNFPLAGRGYMGNKYTVLATASPGGGLQHQGTATQWKALTFEFTPTTNCPGVMFGPAQDSSIQAGMTGSYTVYDGLNLQVGEAGHCDAEGQCS